MKLELKRKWLDEEWTIGEVYKEGVRECLMVEDRVRSPGVKIPGITAIPAGTYAIVLFYSRKWRRRMPYLIGVPGFTGVQIHPGRKAASARDSRGCLVTGIEADLASGVLSKSGEAFETLMDALTAAMMMGKMLSIEIHEREVEFDRRVVIGA